VSYFRANFAILISVTLLSSSAFASHVHRSPTAGASHHSHKLSGSAHHRAWSRRAKGQQAIAPDRVTQIQQALIREHYMTGDADGNWDINTVTAMQKYQADHGWQTKLMPDSRALVKLGLGPDYSNAINAKNSNFAAPPPVSSIPADQVSGFTAAAHLDHQ
jgi:Putative peptidoglycan binding domain